MTHMGRVATFEKPFSINEVFRKGHQWTNLGADAADRYLDLVTRQKFVDFVAKDTGPHSKNYEQRYHVEWLGKTTPTAFEKLVDETVAQVTPPLQPMYGELQVSPPFLYQCKQGYAMDWHDHLNHRSILTVLIYLSPDDIQDEDGGQLEVAQCLRNDDGLVVHRKVMGTKTPKHGDVAILDSQTPLWQHRAMPFHADKSRYFLSISVGSPTF